MVGVGGAAAGQGSRDHHPSHGAPAVTLFTGALSPQYPPPPSNSISPTKSNTLYNRTHCILCQTLWNPVESKRSSASMCKTAERQRWQLQAGMQEWQDPPFPPNHSTSPRWVAVTRWSPAADPLLIDLDTPRHQIATSPIFY